MLQGSRRQANTPGGCLRLTLLSRAYCHLCDDMRAAVAPIAEAHGATLSVIDVDADQTLEAVYGDRVPVLFLGAPGSGVELAHYVCDAALVNAALAAAASPAASSNPELC